VKIDPEGAVVEAIGTKEAATELGAGEIFDREPIPLEETIQAEVGMPLLEALTNA
jgi:hypothetical protein